MLTISQLRLGVVEKRAYLPRLEFYRKAQIQEKREVLFRTITEGDINRGLLLGVPSRKSGILKAVTADTLAQSDFKVVILFLF